MNINTFNFNSNNVNKDNSNNIFNKNYYASEDINEMAKGIRENQDINDYKKVINNNNLATGNNGISNSNNDYNNKNDFNNNKINDVDIKEKINSKFFKTFDQRQKSQKSIKKQNPNTISLPELNKEAIERNLEMQILNKNNKNNNNEIKTIT